VNVGKSIKVAMAMRDMNPAILAERLVVSRQYVSNLIHSKQIGIGTISKLSDVFNMKVSDFLALGED
jgi:plasmid maintenance system antidote protein VapI